MLSSAEVWDLSVGSFVFGGFLLCCITRLCSVVGYLKECLASVQEAAVVVHGLATGKFVALGQVEPRGLIQALFSLLPLASWQQGGVPSNGQSDPWQPVRSHLLADQ